jgi:hypothetical protein
MKGGYFLYKQWQIRELITGLENEIEMWEVVGESCEPRDLDADTINEFRDAVKVLKKSFIYVQRIDRLLSGDDNEMEFHKKLNEELS